MQFQNFELGHIGVSHKLKIKRVKTQDSQLTWDGIPLGVSSQNTISPCGGEQISFGTNEFAI